MITLYLVALAFGLTLLVASLVLGGKDTDHGGGNDGHGHADGAIGGFLPVMSLRFWVFLLTFGGGAGVALTKLGSSVLVAALGAGAIGYAAGMLAVLVIRSLNKNSVSSESYASEIIGMTGTLVLPVKRGEPGKVRVEYKGRAEDFIANTEDDRALATGTSVLIISKGAGDDDSVVVSLDDSK